MERVRIVSSSLSSTTFVVDQRNKHKKKNAKKIFCKKPEKIQIQTNMTE